MMKKKMIVICMSLAILFGGLLPFKAIAQQPDYEKYGRIAITVVKEDFPSEEVKEYKYLGRKKISETEVMDSFEFQVTENGKPVTVVVYISHNLADNKLLSLTVEKKQQDQNQER
jgi:capsular polysaccharide biosynthesis protein